MKKIKAKLLYLKIMVSPFWKYDKTCVIVHVLWECINSVLVSVLYITMTQLIINMISDGSNWRTVISILLLYAAILFAQHMVGDILWKFYVTPHMERVKNNIEEDVFEMLRNTDYKYFDTPEFYDEFTVTYGNYAEKSEETITFVSSIMGSLCSIGALITMIVNSNAWILLIVVFSAVLRSIIALKRNKLQLERKDKLSRLDRIMDYCHDIMISRDSAMDLKTTKMGKVFDQRYQSTSEERINVNKQIYKKEMKINTVDAIQDGAITFLIRATTCLMILAGSIGVGSFVAMISAADQLSYKVRFMTGIVDQLNKCTLEGERISKFLALKSNIEQPNVEKKKLICLSSLELKNIYFTYPNSTFELKNINMRIRKGEKIAIVGENGSGKTTLTKLILRLYDPEEGCILINGQDIREYNIENVRNSIGVAFQESPIYALTLKENLSAYTEIEDKRINEIYKQIPLLYRIIMKNDASFDSYMTKQFDKNGIMLSGGERQIISFSRVMTKHFELLLFDEPTASLDPIAADELSKSIFSSSNKTTSIVVSHRLSNVVDADYIYVMNGGEIIEEGTHASLMKCDGQYRKMFITQAKKYKDGLSK